MKALSYSLMPDLMFRRRDQAFHHRKFFALSLGSPQEPSPDSGHLNVDGKKPPFESRHEIIARP